MTPEQATALRTPFDQVQKVKKEWTNKQGEHKSITLDYIGHGPVTDRLLSVDPGFSFEPLLDEHGFPIVVTAGLSMGDTIGVWGRLTILGTSVVEFCSGKDLMDAYSRCLCRCAMRRGVALDLWIKDDFKPSGAAGGVEGSVGQSAERTAGPNRTAAIGVPGQEVGLTAAPEARSWAKVTEGISVYGPEVHDDFMLFASAARKLLFDNDGTESLNAEQKKELLDFASDALLYVMQYESPLRDDLREAWASVLDGRELAIAGEE